MSNFCFDGMILIVMSNKPPLSRQAIEKLIIIFANNQRDVVCGNELVSLDGYTTTEDAIWSWNSLLASFHLLLKSLDL
jgi:hypothetical protein